jgi:7-cyano-7-deazaguanine reductase
MPSTPNRELETFPSPESGRDYCIRIRLPEYTCLCPETGQPDFAELTLEYVPAELCVELKSLKLYIGSFRDEGAFHEAVTNRILADLVTSIRPRFMRLTADINVRGGIYTSVVAPSTARPAGSRPPPSPCPDPLAAILTEPCYVGVHLGTSGCRAAAIDGEHRVIAEARTALRESVRDDARGAEQDPRLWWDAVVCVLRELTSLLHSYDPRALCADGASSTLLLCSPDEAPLCPALMYHDARGGAGRRRRGWQLWLPGRVLPVEPARPSPPCAPPIPRSPIWWVPPKAT